MHLMESSLHFHSLLKFAWFIKLSCEAQEPIVQDLHSYQYAKTKSSVDEEIEKNI